MRKKKKTAVIILIVIICIIMFMFFSIKFMFLQEDLLFFQFFNSMSKPEYTLDTNYKINDISQENTIKSNSKNLNAEQLIFYVQYRDTQLKDLNLSQTIDNKTLVYEKIAPGTKGAFDIILMSKEAMNYKISFKSQNEKPSNLQFYTIQNHKIYSTLEELGDTLKGTILENEEKKIHINWEWCYEISEQNNQKDTEEAKKINEYKFLIYVEGY